MVVVSVISVIVKTNPDTGTKTQCSYFPDYVVFTTMYSAVHVLVLVFAPSMSVNVSRGLCTRVLGPLLACKGSRAIAVAS